MIVLLCILCMFAVAVASLLLYRRYLQQQVVKKSNVLFASGGISSVEEVTLGGVKQYILIQAKDISKPVLLVLHGGPSLPVPGVGFRGVDWVFNMTTSELIERFTLVYWDQWGTGKSYSPIVNKSSLNVEQFVANATELTDILRARFDADKIFLAGASWGSLIGIQLAHRLPEKFHAYLGIAQIVNWAQSDKIAYDWLLKRADELQNKKAIVELASIGSPPYHDTMRWNLLRKWLFMLGGLIYDDPQIRHPGKSEMFKKNAFYKGMKVSCSRRMLEDISHFDALSTIHKIEVPVYFFHGEHDRAMSGKLLERFYEQLDAPRGKQLTWLPNSAHIYSRSDSLLVEKLVIDFAGGFL